MREYIVIKRNDENLKYIVINYEWKEISVADLLDEYEKLCHATFCIKNPRDLHIAARGIQRSTEKDKE